MERIIRINEPSGYMPRIDNITDIVNFSSLEGLAGKCQDESFLKRDQPAFCNTMDPEGIMLSEIEQIRRDVFHVASLICGVERKQTSYGNKDGCLDFETCYRRA